MTRNALNSVLLAVVLLSASAIPASALPTFTSGSFGFATGTTTTTSVVSTTSFALTTPSILSTSSVGDFSGVVIPFTTSLGISNPLNFLAPTSTNFSDAGLGSFAATSASLIGSTGGTNASATWDVVGTFTLGTDWANSGAVLTANETWSLTQTGGAGEAISVSGTFHSPQVPTTVPEPATLTLLGLGLIAAGSLRRRKVSAS